MRMPNPQIIIAIPLENSRITAVTAVLACLSCHYKLAWVDRQDSELFYLLTSEHLGSLVEPTHIRWERLVIGTRSPRDQELNRAPFSKSLANYMVASQVCYLQSHSDRMLARSGVGLEALGNLKPCRLASASVAILLCNSDSGIVLAHISFGGLGHLTLKSSGSLCMVTA